MASTSLGWSSWFQVGPEDLPRPEANVPTGRPFGPGQQQGVRRSCADLRHDASYDVAAAGEETLGMAVALLLIVVATTLAVVAMLLVRRFLAPTGSYLHDMEPADGIFGAAGAGLAVLLAFVIFTVFESYQNARTGTGTEAVATQ